MELSHEEVEEYLETISTRSKIIDIDNKLLIFKYPLSIHRMFARQVYKSEYDKSISEGMLTTDQMMDLIEKRNLLTDDDKKRLSKIDSQLEAQRILLAKTTKVKANQDRIKGVIAGLKQEKSDIESRSKSKLSMAAETRAEESKVLYLCCKSTFDFNKDILYWGSFEVFNDETDYSFRQQVVSGFIQFYIGLNTSIIRAIARSNLWRIKYITSIKTGESLFGIPVSEYSGDMLNLAYWSHYYNNINEMMPEDQPPDDIIEDDEALDAFMKDYYDERSKDVADRKHRKGNKGKLSAFNSEEVIVARTNELFEDIEFDEPREAAAIRDRTLVQKKTRRA